MGRFFTTDKLPKLQDKDVRAFNIGLRKLMIDGHEFTSWADSKTLKKMTKADQKALKYIKMYLKMRENGASHNNATIHILDFLRKHSSNYKDEVTEAMQGLGMIDLKGSVKFDAEADLKNIFNTILYAVTGKRDHVPGDNSDVMAVLAICNDNSWPNTRKLVQDKISDQSSKHQTYNELYEYVYRKIDLPEGIPEDQPHLHNASTRALFQHYVGRKGALHHKKVVQSVLDQTDGETPVGDIFQKLCDTLVEDKSTKKVNPIGDLAALLNTVAERADAKWPSEEKFSISKLNRFIEHEKAYAKEHKGDSPYVDV